jgi:hypothetical protein
MEAVVIKSLFVPLTMPNEKGAQRNPVSLGIREGAWRKQSLVHLMGDSRDCLEESDR